ncbi:MAG: dTDP-4-dehydrorhamnose reductase [Bacteroidetes bacterium]|nr:dTDP-4-dehydrorhamnose reductase [Bacteroidota bacterium]
MAKILVTGAGGQLGQEIKTLSSQYPQFDFIFADRSELPIDNAELVYAFIQKTQADVCINCAAYTAVDKAESDQDSAYRINGDGPGYLALACRDIGARLIHVSTDYVFDGTSATPLTEDDPTGPINVYGDSKLKGEQQALINYYDGTVIIRTSWVYSEFGNNFVKTMMRLMNERPSINVVDDQIGSPTYAADLAAAILTIVTADSFVPGIYHYSNEGEISWYDFALAIRQHIGSTCTVNPIPSSGFPTPAKRPHYSLLDKSLIKETYNLTIPDWQSSLKTCISRLRP